MCFGNDVHLIMRVYISRFTFIFLFALWPLSAEGPAKKELRRSAYELPNASEPFRYIRVYLTGGVPEVHLKTLSPFQVKDKLNRVIFSGDKMSSTTLKPGVQGIYVGSRLLKSIPLNLESQGGGFQIGGRTYRHILQVWEESGGKLLVVNEIPIEDYLRGVLPSEMSAEWPLEALKAQAIASRTFALFRMMENQNDRYDLTKDVLSQVYKGKALEHSASSRAVRETQGEILTYQGKVFPSFFHSTCGGRTANMADLWDMQEHPSMKGVSCEFCKLSRHYRWSSEIAVREVEANLKKAGYTISGIQKLQLDHLDPGGRAATIWVYDSKGKKKFRASDFRFLAGPDKIKSTLIEKIERRGDTFYFRGRGWGHGAGLCQYGARHLAELGYTAVQILRFYYPDAEITQFWPQNQFL